MNTELSQKVNESIEGAVREIAREEAEKIAAANPTILKQVVRDGVRGVLREELATPAVLTYLRGVALSVVRDELKRLTRDV